MYLVLYTSSAIDRLYCGEVIEAPIVATVQIAVPWRRIVAYLFDWLVLLFYIALLLIVVLLILPACGIDPFAIRLHPLQGQLLGLSTVTLPVLLYFAAFEASRWQATPGKRLMHLSVA